LRWSKKKTNKLEREEEITAKKSVGYAWGARGGKDHERSLTPAPTGKTASPQKLQKERLWTRQKTLEGGEV